MALYRHVAIGVFPGESWSFTLHTLGSADLATAQTTWSDAITALWTGKLDALVATDVELTEVTTASMDQATGKQISRLSDDVSLPGVAATATLPPQNAVAVSWRSDTATRAGRGRLYLPPFATGALAAGRLSGASVTDVVAAVKAMADVIVGAALQPVLYSRTKFTTTAITKFDVGDVVDTQRRRRDKLIEVRTSSAL